MKQQVQHVLDRMFGNPQTMDPAELEARIEVLESKVESNTAAIEELEAERARSDGRMR